MQAWLARLAGRWKYQVEGPKGQNTQDPRLPFELAGSEFGFIIRRSGKDARITSRTTSCAENREHIQSCAAPGLVYRILQHTRMDVPRDYGLTGGEEE